MLDKTFQLLPWTNIMSYSRENNDFSGMQIWYFPLQGQLESQPDNCFKSPMPKFQSWSILGTNLLRSHLRTNASPMLNLQYWHMVIFLPQAFLFFLSLLLPSLVEFFCIPYSIVLGESSYLVPNFIPCFTPLHNHFIISPSISNIIW